MSQEILVLNNSYMPIAKTSAERSIVLILLDKAFSVKDSDKVLRSKNLSINVPEAIVIKDLTFFKRETVMPTKKNVMKLYNYTCQRCQEQRRDRLSLEHLIPRSRFNVIKKERDLDYDVNDWSNVTCLCRACNVDKSNKLPEEIGWNFTVKEPIGELMLNWQALWDLGL